MTLQDTANKLIIKKLVRNYFDLDEESLKLFNFRLNEPSIAPEYKKLLDGDLRCRRDLPSSMMERFDSSWSNFKEEFPEFCHYYNLQYVDYTRNKIVIEKNDIRLKKALEIFYTKLIFKPKIFENVSLFQVFLNRCGIFVLNNGEVIGRDYNGYENYIIFERYSNREVLKLAMKGFKVSTSIEKHITNCIEKTFQEITKWKKPDKKLQIVLSCNFADWFLCSTGENWTSCLNLNSSYENSYWAGLPGIIGDKNRAMIYITDGIQKDFKGIKVDRFLYRGWIFTIRNKETKQKSLFSPMVYPDNFNLEELATEAFGLSFIKKPDNKWVSKYYSEVFYHNEIPNTDKKISTTIYTDGIDIRIAKKNRAKLFPNKYAYFKVGSNGAKRFDSNGKLYYDEDAGFRCRSGLSGLIADNYKITDYFNGFGKEPIENDYEEDYDYDGEEDDENGEPF